MTSHSLIAKKLARIERCVAELKRVDPAAIADDVVYEMFAEHALQVAVQAAIDVASHIVSDERLGDADTNQMLFELLARHGWIPREHVAVMKTMVGFRNVVVHEYDDVDTKIVRDIVEHHTCDLLRFVDAIRVRLNG